MCDIPLHNPRFRDAEKGDCLVLTAFTFGAHEILGFGRPEDGSGCMTRIENRTLLSIIGADNKARQAVFKRSSDDRMWYDGLAFDGEVVSLQAMPLCTRAEVLELPDAPFTHESPRAKIHGWPSTI